MRMKLIFTIQLEGKFAYAKRGSRTVAIKGVKSSNSCSIMLGANLAGDVKLHGNIFRVIW
jgi:hypothetical protein